MEIDRSAPVVASSEIEVAAPPEVAWDVLADLDAWPAWNPDVQSMSIEGPVSPGARFKWRSGPLKITSTLRSVERPNLIGWTGKAPGIDAVHVWRFEPRDGGTLVRTEESWAGLLPRLFGGRLRKTLQDSLDAALPHLKAEAERRSPG
jgi:carbon monoxide dehydrogenase subunit G